MEVQVDGIKVTYLQRLQGNRRLEWVPYDCTFDVRTSLPDLLWAVLTFLGDRVRECNTE